MKKIKSFASDNNAPVHHKVMEAMFSANTGSTPSYGDDEYTRRAEEKFKKVFSEDIDVYFVYNGTGANVLGISAASRPFNAVLCADTAHINCDECGAPEKFSGCKLISVPNRAGKITVGDIVHLIAVKGVEHHSQPGVVSITQTTELGTAYTPDEIRELSDFAHDNGMILHMDGARIANAAAFLNIDVRDITCGAGVDVLSFGGAKNGMMFGEAVVFFNRSLGENFKYYRKQGAQLASKMRYISAQFNAMLTDDLWLDNARQANNMALLLANNLKGVKGVEIVHPVEANAVFAALPRHCIERLQEEYYFYMWDEQRSIVRWMASFDTKPEEVHAFTKDIVKLLGESIP